MSRAAAPQGLIGALLALALTVQAMFAVPLAIGMAAGDAWLLRIGASLCTVGHGVDTQGAAPAAPPGSYAHDHCLICHGPAPFCAVAAAAVVLLVVLFSRRMANGLLLASGAPQTVRFRPYLSRAPPQAA